MISVVDTSKHQGPINHKTMRARGVKGRILRISHGLVLDDRAQEHFNGSVDAGYPESEIGWYPFINPKRSSAKTAARFMLQKIFVIHGRLDTFVMYDCESFINEPPLDVPAARGRAYTDWLHEFDETVAAEAPQLVRLMYTNQAFWNPWTLMNREFGHLDLLAARYPIYPSVTTQNDPARLAAWIASSPKPPANADLWDEWIMGITQSRPQIPAGWDDWDGWQFSAGYNMQGRVYGCSSDSLDLCVVKPEAWARWTRNTTPSPTPLPPIHLPVETPDMSVIITNQDVLDGHWQPGTMQLLLQENGFVRHLDGPEYEARTFGWTAAQKANRPQWSNDLIRARWAGTGPQPAPTGGVECLFHETVIPAPVFPNYGPIT